MSPSERRALFFLLGVLALGVTVRGVRTLRDAPDPATSELAALDSQILAVGDASRRSAARRPRSRESRPESRSAAGRLDAAAIPIDLDRAGAEELATLPGIGPTLAARIVADRERCGPFGSLEEFQRVPGVGPRMAERLEGRVTFSGAVRRGQMLLDHCVSGASRTSTTRRKPRP